MIPSLHFPFYREPTWPCPFSGLFSRHFSSAKTLYENENTRKIGKSEEEDKKCRKSIGQIDFVPFWPGRFPSFNKAATREIYGNESRTQLLFLWPYLFRMHAYPFRGASSASLQRLFTTAFTVSFPHQMEKHLHRTQTNILYLVRPFVSCHIKCWLINSINLSLSSPSQQNDKQDFSKSTDTEKARDKIWKRKRVREKCIDNGPSFSAAHIHFIGVPFWPKKLYIGQARQKNPIWCQIFICTFGAFETMQCLPHETAANICSTFPLRAANYYAMLPFPRKAHFLANGKKREIQ